MASINEGTDTPTPAPINVPDKPALEGLETALNEGMTELGQGAHALRKAMEQGRARNRKT